MRGQEPKTHSYRRRAKKLKGRTHIVSSLSLHSALNRVYYSYSAEGRTFILQKTNLTIVFCTWRIADKEKCRFMDGWLNCKETKPPHWLHLSSKTHRWFICSANWLLKRLLRAEYKKRNGKVMQTFSKADSFFSLDGSSRDEKQTLNQKWIPWQSLLGDEKSFARKQCPRGNFEARFQLKAS